MSKMDDLAAVAAKWGTNTKSQSAIDAYKRGTSGVAEAPTVTAARFEDKFLAKVQDSVTSGRRRAALLRSTKEDYARGCVVGSTRIASGVEKGQQKFMAHLSASKPVYDALKSALASVPNMDEASALERVRITMEHMKRLKK